MVDDTANNENSTVTGREREGSTWSKDDWASLASDPDTAADLGYELSEWEQFETLDGTDQVMFLPNDESELKDAAFVVAEERDLLDLENHC